MKKIPCLLAVLVLGLIILSSCNNAETTKSVTILDTKPAFDLAVARQEIEAVNQTFMDKVAKGDSVGVAGLYTDDAKLMFAGAPAVVGKAGIQTAFSGIMRSGVTKVDLRTTAVFGTEHLVAEEGNATIYVNDKVVGEEKYIVLWKKVDGNWKILRDIANSNVN